MARGDGGDWLCTPCEYVSTSCPELVILGTVDEDVAGGVAGEEEVAGRDQDAQAGNPGGRHRHFLDRNGQYCSLLYETYQK